MPSVVTTRYDDHTVLCGGRFFYLIYWLIISKHCNKKTWLKSPGISHFTELLEVTVLDVTRQIVCDECLTVTKSLINFVNS